MSLNMVVLTLWQEIGFKHNEQQGECLSKFACHLDCFAWVKRDSYLPQGSQGLKVRHVFPLHLLITALRLAYPSFSGSGSGIRVPDMLPLFTGNSAYLVQQSPSLLGSTVPNN